MDVVGVGDLVQQAVTEFAVMVGVCVSGFFAFQLVRWGLNWANYFGSEDWEYRQWVKAGRPAEGKFYEAEQQAREAREGGVSARTFTSAQVAAIKAKKASAAEFPMNPANPPGADGKGSAGVMFDPSTPEWELAGMSQDEFKTACESWSNERWATHWAMIARQKEAGTFNYGRPLPDDDDVPF
jgi:hypothetical protein